MGFNLNEIGNVSLKLIRDTIDNTVELGQKGIKGIVDNTVELGQKGIELGQEGIKSIVDNTVELGQKGIEFIDNTVELGQEGIKSIVDNTVELGQKGIEFIVDNREEIIRETVKIVLITLHNRLNEDDLRDESFDGSYGYGESYESSSYEIDYQDIINGEYTCTECGNDFDEEDIDWSISDEESGYYYCSFCSHSLEQDGIDAMDPDGFGYDEYGNWDSERLGL